MQQKNFDIIIIGGGMVGSALACALAQQTSLSIAIIESQAHVATWSAQRYEHRVSAIALSSQRIFQSLGVWESIRQKRVSPFTKIHVWDSAKHADIQFDSQEIAEPILGYIIENNVVQAALNEKITSHTRINWLAPVKLVAVEESADHISLLSEDTKYTAKLVVAADGANSWLRSKLNIGVDKLDYEQTAIVTTVQTELPHQRIASQVFLKEGPLAFLPLNEDNLSSIVWSLPQAEAQRVLDLNDDDFKQALSQAFEQRLGAVLHADKRFSFPLAKSQAKQYVSTRIALVGDAAHTVHPLAGQGVNMGLLDAASLAQVISAALQKNRDYASYATLRAYERWRRADNANLLIGVDAIKKLFASQHPVIQSARAYGLNVTNHMHWIKNIFTRHAVGNRQGLPDMANQYSG